MSERELTEDDDNGRRDYSVWTVSKADPDVWTADRFTIGPTGALTLWLDGEPTRIFAPGFWREVEIQA